MNEIKLIGFTKDGEEVYTISKDSHSHRNDLNKEVVEKVVAAGRNFFKGSVDMGRIIGKDHLVETDDDDIIVRFDRGRGYESRMVLSKEPEDTSIASYIIARGDENDGELNGKLILITVYEGDLGEPEPYRNNYYNETSINFWRTHALVPTEEEREGVERLYTLEKVNKLFIFLNNLYA